MIELGWYMDGHLPWRLAFLRAAQVEAQAQMVRAQERVADLRRQGHQKRSPELRAARLENTQRSLLYATLAEVRNLLAPPVSGPERCSQGTRRWYTNEQAAVLRAASEFE